MGMFYRQAYSRIMALRATSAGSWAILVCTLFAAALGNPPSWITLVGGCAVFVWMATAPGTIMSYFAGMNWKLNWRMTQGSTIPTPWSVVRLARTMGAPIPCQVQVVASDQLNAATDGTTLFMTSAMERESLTRSGENIIAHELGHVKSGHPRKRTQVVIAVAVVSLLFGAPFLAVHEIMSAVMGVLAFLTLMALVSPLASRQMEYDADAEAAVVGGRTAMIAALLWLAPSEKWDLESDSHPSIQARVQRLRDAADLPD